MDIFGWSNHAERLKANWNRVVGENDTVIIPGDLSWGLKLSEAAADFHFIDSLNGKKYILKGNHDLWWQTRRKMEQFFEEEKITTIKIIYNDSVQCEGYRICGTRGWFFDDVSNADKKVILREAGRLEASLNFAPEDTSERIVFLHYPPVYAGQVCDEIWSVIKKHGIKRVYYGHIHGVGHLKCVSQYDDVSLRLIACDYTDFTPIQIV